MERADLVFPQGNEESLVEMARELGTRTLLMCYPLSDPAIRERAGEVAKLSSEQVSTAFSVLVRTQDEVQRALKLTQEIVSLAHPAAYEDKRVRYIIGFEGGTREDFIHHRNAGLTQVSIAHAMRTGKTLLVDAGQLLSAEQPAHVILGRMLQNNMLFRKYRPSVLAVSGAREALDMRSTRDLGNLLLL
jgi:RNase P/RNase MRP subunit p30